MRCKAYQTRMDREAWLHGRYVLEAFSSVLSSAFAKDNTKPYEYPNKPLMELESEKQRNKEKYIKTKKYEDKDLQRDQDFRDVWASLY